MSLFAPDGPSCSGGSLGRVSTSWHGCSTISNDGLTNCTPILWTWTCRRLASDSSCITNELSSEVFHLRSYGLEKCLIRSGGTCFARSCQKWIFLLWWGGKEWWLGTAVSNRWDYRWPFWCRCKCWIVARCLVDREKGTRLARGSLWVL